MNALAHRACPRDDQGRYGADPVTAETILEAQEELIVSRETHLDQLADKLQEERVRRVVGPLLSGGDERDFSARDIEYVRDLGLIARHGPLRMANPICAEVVPRELTCAAQEGLVQDAAWYMDEKGLGNVGRQTGRPGGEGAGSGRLAVAQRACLSQWEA